MLRVGIGIEVSCMHTFDCPSCRTPISIFAKTGTPPTHWIEMGENINKIDRDDTVAHIINLHPSFAFNREDYHSPYVFASMQAGTLIFNHIRSPANDRHKDIALDFEVPNTSQIWPIVRNVLTLAINGDPAGILSQQIKKYESERAKHRPSFKCETQFKCLASFFDDIFYPAIGKLRSPLRAFVKEQKSNNPAEFQRLLDFYNSDLQRDSINRYSSIFSDYFRYFDQLRQVLAHARVGNEAVDDLIVGSKRFDEIKLYYGQAYETLTSAYTLLAALFNLSEGRTFDSFKSMNLKKYMTDVEKSKKSNPFLAIPELAAFTTFEDSALRNGSHHASIWRDGELIRFRSGGTGAERDIAFARYLHICNGITIAIAALFLVELEFFSSMRIS